MLFADDDQPRAREAFENVCQERAGGLPGSMGIHNINLRLGRFEMAHVRREGGLELFADDLELRLRQEPLELAQNQRVGREQTNREAAGRALCAHKFRVLKTVQTGKGYEYWCTRIVT